MKKMKKDVRYFEVVINNNPENLEAGANASGVKTVCIVTATELLVAISERYQQVTKKGTTRSISVTESNFKKVDGGEDVYNLMTALYIAISKLYTFRDPFGKFNQRDIKRVNAVCRKMAENPHMCTLESATIRSIAETCYCQTVVSDNSASKTGKQLQEISPSQFIKAFSFKVGKEISGKAGDLRSLRESNSAMKLRGANWLTEISQ